MIRHFHRKAAPFAAAAAAALALAACGTDTGTEPTNDTSAEQTDAEAGQTGDTATGAGQFAVDVRSTGDPFADAKAAAGHVEQGAQTLAEGIAAAAGMDGDPNSGAAGLRASLTGLLQEHVYLAGFAVDTAYGFGPDSDEFSLAAAALDENSVELADLVGSAAGDDNRQAFLDLWRQHIGFFVDYAVAQAGGDQQARQQALDNLQGYTGDAGAFFENITGGELPAAAVAQSLEGHIASLTSAIDAFAAGDATAFDKLKGAADHVVAGAATLAGGIAAAIDADGDTESQASQLRSGLTAALQEHVYLAGIAVKTAYAEGADSPAFEAAAATLDANSVELADGVGQVAGPENREAFLDLWRQHIGFFVDYAVATAEGNEQGQQQAIAELEGYTNDAGAFFENITAGQLPAAAVAEHLRGHISTLAGAINSLNAAIN